MSLRVFRESLAVSDVESLAVFREYLTVSIESLAVSKEFLTVSTWSL